ncbi:MAG: YccF domain-containing protein [Bacteroidales bacterium]|nr:YccF domain-containing protein [Bacteroidales bacterium]
MSFIGNILWLVLGGLLIGLAYIVVGLLFCLTIIGIPFGVQLMKIGLYTFCPFGREVEFVPNPPSMLNVILNVLWVVLGWFEIAVAHLVVGIILCITIIGIPFGLQHFKIMKLSFIPFGQKIV